MKSPKPMISITLQAVKKCYICHGFIIKFAYNIYVSAKLLTPAERNSEMVFRKEVWYGTESHPGVWSVNAARIHPELRPEKADMINVSIHRDCHRRAQLMAKQQRCLLSAYVEAALSKYTKRLEEVGRDEICIGQPMLDQIYDTAAKINVEPAQLVAKALGDWIGGGLWKPWIKAISGALCEEKEPPVPAYPDSTAATIVPEPTDPRYLRKKFGGFTPPPGMEGLFR